MGLQFYHEPWKISVFIPQYWTGLQSEIRIMSMIRKLIANKVLVKVQKCFGSSRTLHLTAAELDDRNVIKSDGEVVIPDLTIPEIIVPKLEAYKNYTAVVSED